MLKPLENGKKKEKVHCKFYRYIPGVFKQPSIYCAFYLIIYQNKLGPTIQSKPAKKLALAGG